MALISSWPVVCPRPHCPYEGLKPGMPRGIIGDGVFGPHCPYEGLKQRLLVPRP